MSEQNLTDENIVTFDSRVHAAALALDLVETARQEICFFGPSLDHVLFDNVDMIDRLSEFARRNPRTHIRFVVFDTRHNIAQRHRLLPLAQRLSSKIDIHIAAKAYQETRQMFLLVDTTGYLYCPDNTRYEGEAALHAPLKVRELKQKFEDIWTHSAEDINTRRLSL